MLTVDTALITLTPSTGGVVDAILVLRDWLLSSGKGAREADDLLGKRSGRPASIPDLLVLDAPADLVALALGGLGARPADELVAELEGAADLLESELGDSLDWLCAARLPDGEEIAPAREVLARWTYLRDHPGSSFEEPEVVLEERATGVRVLLVWEGPRGWVGTALSPQSEAERWPEESEGGWTHAIDEGDLVDTSGGDLRLHVVIDAEDRQLLVVPIAGGGTPVYWYHGHVLAFAIPGGIRGDLFGDELLAELGSELRCHAKAWQGIVHDGRNRVGRWAEGYGPGGEHTRSLEDAILEIAHRHRPVEQLAESCRQRLDRWQQEGSEEDVRRWIREGMLVNEPDAPYLADPEEAERIGELWLESHPEEEE